MGTSLQQKASKFSTMEMRVSEMLIRYKKSCEKIAMGLLSFVPSEKDLKSLKQTMKKYDEHPDYHLYLWKKGDDFIGLIGVEAKEDFFLVHHISVMPSFRREGIGRIMVEKIQEIMKPLEMRSTEETRQFIESYRLKSGSHK